MSSAARLFQTAYRDIAPGIGLALGVAVLAFLAEAPLSRLVLQATGRAYAVPTMVLALVIGIALHGFATRPAFAPGISWCVKKLLRAAIALLGLRIAFADIAGLGLGAGALIVVSMLATLASGVLLARFFRCSEGYGALAGAATAVCGASATLATTTVVPDYKGKDADTAFTVVAVNALSTVAMVAYPPLCLWLGLSASETGILLGATIHDVAQVVGAGYAVSEPVGNAAVIVKLFRVFLLLPMVLIVGWWFVRRGAHAGAAKVPVPVFAIVFVALAALNSLLLMLPAALPLYLPVKAALGQVSTWGLLISIAALGLGTSLTAILRIGWRHILVLIGTTTALLLVVAGGLFLLR